MKTFLKIFSLMISILLINASMALANMPEKAPVPQKPAAQSQSKAIESLKDDASLLSSAEFKQIADKINKVEKKYGVQIGIVTASTIQNQAPEKVANALLNAKFNNGRNGNIVLLISMDTREWHISTDALMNQKITNGVGLPYVTEHFLSKLSSGDYSGALNSYVDSIDELLNYYAQNDAPYDPSNGFNPMAAMAAVVISIFIGLMIRSSLIASMSNVRPAIEASEYLDKNTLQLTENRDTFLYMNVQRRPKSHGGGSHGGGGSSGGGGGRGGSF